MKINPCIELVELTYFTKYFNDKNNPIKKETLHEHDEYELFVMLEGEATYTIAGADYFPQSTQIIVVPPRNPIRNAAGATAFTLSALRSVGLIGFVFSSFGNVVESRLIAFCVFGVY